MKRLHALVLATGAAFAAPTFAETVTYYLWDPVQNTYVERSVERSVPPSPAATVTYSAPPSTTTYVAPATTTYVAPTTTTYPAPTITYVEPVPTVTEEIIVTAPRMTQDQAITADVVDRIATNPNISGRIGVETYNREVTLTGRTATEGQAERAEREAKSVEGVREVNNLIRPRVGKF